MSRINEPRQDLDDVFLDNICEVRISILQTSIQFRIEPDLDDIFLDNICEVRISILKRFAASDLHTVWNVKFEIKQLLKRSQIKYYIQQLGWLPVVLKWLLQNIITF